MARFSITGLFEDGTKFYRFFEDENEATREYEAVMRFSTMRMNINLWRLDDSVLMKHHYQLGDADYKRLGI